MTQAYPNIRLQAHLSWIDPDSSSGEKFFLGATLSPAQQGGWELHLANGEDFPEDSIATLPAALLLWKREAENALQRLAELNQDPENPPQEVKFVFRGEVSGIGTEDLATALIRNRQTSQADPVGDAAYFLRAPVFSQLEKHAERIFSAEDDLNGRNWFHVAEETPLWYTARHRFAEGAGLPASSYRFDFSADDPIFADGAMLDLGERERRQAYAPILDQTITAKIEDIASMVARNDFLQASQAIRQFETGPDDAWPLPAINAGLPENALGPEAKGVVAFSAAYFDDIALRAMTPGTGWRTQMDALVHLADGAKAKASHAGDSLRLVLMCGLARQIHAESANTHPSEMSTQEKALVFFYRKADPAQVGHMGFLGQKLQQTVLQAVRQR